jgi:hypothetical protein
LRQLGRSQARAYYAGVMQYQEGITMHKEGDIFQWSNDQKAVIVKVLNADENRYYCVYHQNNVKYVVSEFIYTNNTWKLTEESGRQIRDSDWSYHVSKLKNA